MRRLILVCLVGMVQIAVESTGHASARLHYRGVSSLASNMPDGVTCPCTLSGRSLGARGGLSAETFHLSLVSGVYGSASADIWQAWGSGTWSASGRRGNVSGTLRWTQSRSTALGGI